MPITHKPTRHDLLFGENVRQRRRTAKLRQEDVAASLGVKRTTYIAIEQGRRGTTTAEAGVLAEILGCSVADLISQSPPAERELPSAFWQQLVQEVQKCTLPDRLHLLTFARFLNSQRRYNAELEALNGH